MIENDQSEEMTPREYWKHLGGAPCSAYRFASLAAPGVFSWLIFDSILI
jgi:hypothetical protein